MENDFKQLQMEVKALNNKLDHFLDVYYRTHFIDKDVFNNPVIFNNDVSFKGSGGTTIGGSTASLIGFYDATPVDQPATIADPAGGATVDSQARTGVNTLIDRLQELGLIA